MLCLFFRIFQFIFLSLSIIYIGLYSVHAAELPFTDVSSSDDYYADLVTLYERGVIPETPNKRFNPSSLINRDDFVSIVVGVGCKKCLTPSFDDIIKYNSLPFVDFKRDNPNFYCVSYAKDQEIVEGYVVGVDGSSKCESGESFTKTPFCAANKITRIEAAAVLLRQAGLWNTTLGLSNYERKLILPDIDKNWYGYAQKGIQSGIITQDGDGKIRPNENITKQEFVRMAAKIFRVNLCALRNPDFATNANTELNQDSSTNNTTGLNQNLSDTQTGSDNMNMNRWGRALTSEVRILDAGAICNTDTQPSSMGNASATQYTFFGRTETVGGPFSYSWDFARVQDGKRLSGSGACLANFNLSWSGTWLVRLTLKDPATGATSVSSASIEIRDGSPVPAENIRGLSAQIRASILSTSAPFTINFVSKVAGGVGPYSYRWDFNDGSFSVDSNPAHIFETPWVRPVQLTVRDSRGSTTVASLTIVLDESSDLDNDGVLNRDDLCPAVFGPRSNGGCPTLDIYTGSKTNSSITGALVNGFDGLGSANSTLTLSWVGGACKLNYAASRWALFGQAACTTCPCDLDLSFNAEARSCDIIFPAILSEDRKTIFGRGKVFELKF